jgi:hypothetical protein
MNGFSLLLVVATVGTTARVELDTAGQPSYTIRIESVIVEQLRQGQIVDTNVAPADRRTKRFRVLVTDPSARSGTVQTRTDNTARSESLVEYEAVLMDNGEYEMWVQISPERLETLANRPIEGQVPAGVPEIARFQIFVGINQLPQQQTSATAAKDSRPGYLSQDNSGITTAGGEVRPTSDTSRRSSTTPARATPFQSAGSSSFPAGFGSTPAAPPLANANSRSNERISLRNTPDQSPPPPLNGYGPSQVVAPSFGNDPRYNAPTSSRFDDQYSQPNNYNNSGTYNTAGTLNNGGLNYNDRANGYTYGGNNTIAPPPSHILAAQQQQQQQTYPQNQYANNQGYGQSQTMLAARPETQPIQAAAPPGNNWNQPAAAGLSATAQPVTQAAAPTIPANAPTTVSSNGKGTDDLPKTSTPLILTTLALFTSLGVNAYLGWLAWSFFWRYRDAVNDSARARSYNAPGRQAA